MKIVLNPIYANHGIGVDYARQLRKIIMPMVKQTKDIILSDYTQATYSKDARNPVDDINARLTAEERTWQHRYELVADKIARKFVKSIDDNVKYQLGNSFGRMQQEIKDNYVLKMNESYYEALNSAKATIENNIALIKSIPDEFFSRSKAAINNAIALGKNKNILAEELQNVTNITKKRAKLISRDQLFKATSAIDNERRLKLGITKAIWRHSRGDKEPRKSHLAAAGREYDIKRGCLIEGEYIQVGEKINCTCYSQPVIELD